MTIDFTSIEDGLLAFVTVVLILLTPSISQSVLCGFLLHALLYVVVGGRARGHSHSGRARRSQQR